MSSDALKTDMLALVDAPSVSVQAGRAAVWHALLAILTRAQGRPARTSVARALGCQPARNDGRFPSVGSQVPGFRVADCREPEVLTLVGRHRFSTYSLSFTLEALSAQRTDLRAITRASFPGPIARGYRALVISSGAHARLMRSMLASVKSQAETRDATT